MTDDEIIAVVTAKKNGKTIEFKFKQFGESWEKVSNPRWNFLECDYRVNHEQMEIEVWVMEDGKCMEFVKLGHEPSHYREWTKKKFREVVE